MPVRAEPVLAEAYDLVSTARDLLRDGGTDVAGLWHRAAAVLGRQAIESAMAGLWRAIAPGLERENLRNQLLCLAVLLDDEPLAGRVSTAWSCLSSASHIQVYAVPPTAPELLGWLTAAWDLAEVVAVRVTAVGAKPAAVQ